jgi:hypothetical protein
MSRRVWLPTALGLLAGASLLGFVAITWLAAGVTPRPASELIGSMGAGLVCVAASLAGGFGIVRRDLAAGALLAIGAVTGWGVVWSLADALPSGSFTILLSPVLIVAALALAAGVVMARFHVEQPSQPQRDALPQA